MLSRMVKDHQRSKAQLRDENERLRKQAIDSVRNVTEKMVDSVNQGVAHVFANQRKLESEARKLQSETARFARQTNQWLQLVDNFNIAIKELGDVENWAQHIERDVGAIAATLEYVHRKEAPAATGAPV